MNDMFSSLGQLFVTPPRHTETADARMNIRRHDPEYERRKKKKKDDEEVTFDMHDKAMVSIEALEMFLDNFIKAQKNQNADKSAPAPKKPDLENTFKAGAGQPAAQKTSQAARAANAYQNSANIGGQNNIIDAQDDQNVTSSIGDYQLSTDEIRSLKELIENVRTLRRKGISYVSIEKQESFLASLQSAVANALQDT